ncbi:MAG: hypothetical protein GWM88_17080 [Pseudomonadales bacterium]|nr:hypothetical protein [Pseudomonadales bacterium]NIX09646.1 hypothetical protein [Pseudomonadales bacterium]
MNIDDFERGLDRWGTELTSWPDAERAAAQALLERSEPARSLAAQADAMERWLDEGRTHRAPAQLNQKILAQLPRPDIWQQAANWFSSALWRPTLAGACALLLGFALGALLPSTDQDGLVNDVAALAFTETYQESQDAP